MTQTPQDSNGNANSTPIYNELLEEYKSRHLHVDELMQGRRVDLEGFYWPDSMKISKEGVLSSVQGYREAVKKVEPTMEEIARATRRRMLDPTPVPEGTVFIKEIMEDIEKEREEIHVTDKRSAPQHVKARFEGTKPSLQITDEIMEWEWCHDEKERIADHMEQDLPQQPIPQEAIEVLKEKLWQTKRHGKPSFISDEPKEVPTPVDFQKMRLAMATGGFDVNAEHSQQEWTDHAATVEKVMTARKKMGWETPAQEVTLPREGLGLSMWDRPEDRSPREDGGFTFDWESGMPRTEFAISAGRAVELKMYGKDAPLALWAMRQHQSRYPEHTAVSVAIVWYRDGSARIIIAMPSAFVMTEEQGSQMPLESPQRPLSGVQGIPVGESVPEASEGPQEAVQGFSKHAAFGQEIRDGIANGIVGTKIMTPPSIDSTQPIMSLQQMVERNEI